MLTELYYMRRLLCVAVFAPFLTAVLVMPAATAALVGLACGVAALFILGVWPASIIDVLGLSIATALAAPFWSVMGPTVAESLGDRSNATVWFWFVASFGTFFLWLACVRLIVLLEHIPAGSRRNRYSGFSALSPEDVTQALVLRPNGTQHGRRAGPADADGFYPVYFGVDTVRLDDFSPEQAEYSYLMRIVEDETDTRGQRRFVIQSSLDSGGVTRSSIEELVFEPVAGGTQITTREVHDLFTLLSALFAWLQDQKAAGINNLLSAYAEGVCEFSCYPSQETLLTTMARWFSPHAPRPRDGR